MGKNNSVKKIDEEQILKRFEYTVQEYIRFYDFYKNQEVSEENTEAFYVMLQTKLMILRKYDYNIFSFRFGVSVRADECSGVAAYTI